MKINPFIFRNYDIRGKAPEDLDAAKVEAIGRAYGTFLRRRSVERAVVGRDCRLSGPEFKQAYIRGLSLAGVETVDIGMVMTQMVYFSQYYLRFSGATMITASHNPAAYNGFKMATGYSETTMPRDLEEIKKIIADEDFYIAAEIGKTVNVDIKDFYEEDLLKKIKISKKFKVVADFRHGTPGGIVPEILRRFGCEVIERRSSVDGSFPAGTPDPTDEKFMKELGREVLNEKADLGRAFDGDGDRIGVVDEKGNILWNDILLAVFAEEVLEKKPGAKIVYNLLCSKIVPATIKNKGGHPIVWLVGHSFIKDKIAREDAAFGGELSGHLFFRDEFYGHDDGVYAALRLLARMEQKNMTLGELCAHFPKFISSPEIKIGCPDDKKKAAIKEIGAKIKRDFSEAEITDENSIPGNDGIRADFKNRMIVFRYSQNGPYLTIRFEAETEQAYRDLKEYAKKIVSSCSDITVADELCVNIDALA